MRRKTLALCMAVMISATITTGCADKGATDPVVNTSVSASSEQITEEKATPEKEVAKNAARESTKEEQAVLEKIFPGIKERYVLSNSKQVDLALVLEDEYGVVKEVKVASTDMTTNKVGTYDVTYHVTVYTDRMESAQEAVHNDKDIEKAQPKNYENTELIAITETATVISKEKADELAGKGELVLTDQGKEYSPTSEKKETEVKDDKKEKPSSDTDAKKESDKKEADNSKTSTGNSNSGNASSDKTPVKTEEKQPSSSGTTKPEQSATVPREPSKQESHTHSWAPLTKTVHHDAEYQLVYVVDKAAWDEDIYVDQAVYETVPAVRCGCGAEFADYSEWCAHEEYFGDVLNDFSHGSYSVVYHQNQVGTEKVYARTDRHPEEGHMESKIAKDAYDEQVVTGYKCSGCGATK